MENCKSYEETFNISQDKLYRSIRLKHQSTTDSTCMSVQFHPKGKVYAVACSDGYVKIYRVQPKLKQPTLVVTLNMKDERHKCCATSVRFRPWGLGDGNPNNLLISTFTNGRVKTFHYPSSECVHTINENRETLTSQYSVIGDTFATTGNDGTLIVYDDETREKLVEYTPPFYCNSSFRRMYAIAYHPTNRDEILTGGWDGLVRYFDIRVSGMIKEFHGPQITGEGLAISPKGNEVCTASWRRDDPLQLWDYGSGKLIRNVTFKTNVTIQNSSMISSPVWNNLGTCTSTSEESLSQQGFLPPIIATTYYNSLKASKYSGLVDGSASTLPRMLYSCKYFVNSDFIAVSGSLSNGALVINKNTSQVIAGVNDLDHHVYSIDSYNTLLALTSGTNVALMEISDDQN